MKRILFTIVLLVFILIQAKSIQAQTADSLFNEAIQAYRMEENQEAIDLYEKAAEIYLKNGNLKKHLLSKIEVASMYQVTNEYDLSIQLTDSLQVYVEDLNDPEVRFELLEVRGYYEFGMENNLVADSLFTVAHDLALLSGDSLVIAESYGNLAFIDYFLGDFELSMKSAEKALKIYSNTNDAYKKSVHYNIYHFGLLGIFDNEKALDQLIISNKYAYESKSPKIIRTTHYNLTEYYIQHGNYNLAIENLKASLRYTDKSKSLKVYILAYLNYAHILRSIGRLKESIEVYEQVIEDCQYEHCQDLGSILSVLGSAYLDINEHDKARLLYQKADSLLMEPQQNYFNTHQIRIGRFYLETNDTKKAKERALKSIKNIYGDSQISKPYGYTLLSDIEMAQGNFQKSLEYAIQARSLLDSDYMYDEVQTEIDFSLARAYSKLNLDSALTIGFRALNRQFSSEEFTSLYNSYSSSNNYVDELNELISWYIKNNGDKNNVIKLLQLVKNRSNSKLIKRVGQHNDDLYTNLVINDVNRFYSLLSNNDTTFSINELNNELMLANIKSDQLITLDYEDLKDIDEIKQALNSKSALLEYSVYNNGFIILLMTREIEYFKIVEGPYNSSLIKDLNTSISNLNKSILTKSAQSEIQKHASFLFSKLIEPIKDKLKGIEELTIIPDGPLHDLTFDVLIDENDDYLVEKLRIKYLYSSSLLNNIADINFHSDEKLFGYAASNFNSNEYLSSIRGEDLSPLPYAIKEIETISSSFDSKTILKNDHYAEDYIKRTNLRGYSHLHFATHGIVNELNPSYSKLVLTDDIYDLGLTNDGHLTALEVSNLTIDAELVVLSACSTSDRYNYSSSGSMSMQKAFLIAGATGVVGTIWPVYDESTYHFMTRFYDEIMKNPKKSRIFSFLRSNVDDSKRPEVALQKIKKEMISHPYYSHPIYWAGYTYVGN